MRTALRCLAASTLIHSALFASFGLPSCGGAGQDGGAGDSQVKITIIDKSPRSDNGRVEKCPSGFGGIGISYDLFAGGAVTQVYKGYPADRAGILPGDVVVGSPSDIRGEPGTPVSVRVVRAGKELVFDMVRERICTAEDP